MGLSRAIKALCPPSRSGAKDRHVAGQNHLRWGEPNGDALVQRVSARFGSNGVWVGQMVCNLYPQQTSKNMLNSWKSWGFKAQGYVSLEGGVHF